MNKRFKKWTAGVLMALTISTVIAPQAMAAVSSVSTRSDVDVYSVTSMVQLRLEDDGPDLSKGELVSEFWGTEEDGTPYVERLYVKSTSRALDSATYTKTKSYGATGSVEVSAIFKWDTAAKKAYVTSPSGKFNNGGGISETKSEQATTSGTGTTKATAKYSIKVNRNLGGWATYSVSLSCDYKGKHN